MNYGSLFSGVDALGLAVETVFGVEAAWYAESDRHASTVHDLRWPGVPNLGDVDAVDWSAVEPVDLICGGPPCQPFSSAGRRLGVSDDRWMWPAFARAVRLLRPRWVVLENVAALVADSDAFGWVVGDLAEAGFDARWGCLRASDVGAPHQRERLFLVAADAECAPDRTYARGTSSHGEVGRVGARSGGASPPDADCGGLARDSQSDSKTVRSRQQAPRRGDPVRCGQAAPHAEGQGWQGPEPEPTRRGPERGHSATPDAYNERGNGSEADAEPDWWTEPQGRSGPLAAGIDSPVAHAAGDCRPSEPSEPDEARSLVGTVIGTGGGTGNGPTPERVQRLGRGAGVAWGPYASAIARWERIRGIPAPDPVDERGRLNPALSEWMMGLPPGWVTQAPIPRTAMHRCIGNAVVVPCAEVAIRQLAAGLLTAVAA